MLRRSIPTEKVGCSSSGIDEWTLFERKLMRECVDGSVRVEVMMVICIAAEFSVRGYSGPDRVAAVLGTVITVLNLCIKHYIKTQVAESSSSSLAEENCCIAFNGSSVVLFLCALTWRSSQMPMELQAHKGFVSGLIVCLAASVHVHYLPIKWHIICVSLPAMACHIFFHWYVNFWNRTSMCYALFWPAFGFAYYRYLQSREWRAFQSMRREQESRALTEAWELSLRTMLKSVFDATCECNASGRLLNMSPQFAEMFGATIDQLTDSNIACLAYDSQEAKRISTFLASIIHAHTQNGESGVAPKLDSSFRCQNISSKMALTLCGVALPSEHNDLSSLRLLIAWQKSSVQHTAQVALPETQTLQDEDLVAQGDALRDFHSFNFKSVCDVDETSLLSFSLTTTTNTVSCTKSVCDIDETVSLSAPTNTAVRPALAISTKSIGIQTNPVSFRETKELLSRPKPPTLPHAKVTKISLHRGFKATPAKTLQLCLCDLSDRVNPGVTSCCRLHAYLYWMSLSIKALKVRDCSDNWCNVKKAWQCQQCFILNEHNDDDNDDDDDENDSKLSALECDLCGTSCPLASSASSCDADQSRGNRSAQSDDDTDLEE